MSNLEIEINSNENDLKLNGPNQQLCSVPYTIRQLKSAFTPYDTSSSSTAEDNEAHKEENKFIFDLQKYKHDWFLSKLKCHSTGSQKAFGAPTGICTLDNDRLLVANFDANSIFLMDISGLVYNVYNDIPTPKDIIYDSSNPTQVLVATKKDVVTLDLTEGKIVSSSKIKGFYPWNIQYIKHREVIAACDPSGERIVYLDKNLTEIGELSFKDQIPQSANGSSLQHYSKVYPYAVCFLPDDTAFTLANRNDQYSIREYNLAAGQIMKECYLSQTLKGYSIYVDSTRKCLIPDSGNHCLFTIDKNSLIEQHKFNSVYEPYSMTFLSNGTLCITDRSTSHNTNGGIAILSETNLQ